MATVSEEIRFRLPMLVANLALTLLFWVISYIVSITLANISNEARFLSQVGLLFISGIFLVRTAFNALMIVDKVTKSFLRRLGIKEEWSKQRVTKDTIYIVVILLVAAAIFPIFDDLTNFAPWLQQITTYSAVGLILLFVYDIGRTFYRITEKTANSVANRISNSKNKEGE